MKSFTWLLAGLFAASAVMAQGEPVAGGNAATSTAEQQGVTPEGTGQFWSFSYTMGYTMGGRMHAELPELDLTGFQAGLQEAVAGKDPQLDEEQMQSSLKAFSEYRQAKATKAQEEIAVENLVKANAFLAGNAKRKGVKTTKSGLQYEVMKKASGASPKPTDIVRAHYHGTLIDGSVFDSSRDDEPVEFPLNRVIPGWTEGLQLMAKGAQFRFWVPPALAYGAQGIEEAIGPNQVLVFEVELIDFKPAPAPAAAPDVEPAHAPH